MSITISADRQAAVFHNLAMANTSYNIKAGLVRMGARLQFQNDASVATYDQINSRPLNVDTPNGFEIIGVINDSVTGAQAFAAYNASTNEVRIGISGIDGAFSDNRDTHSALSVLWDLAMPWNAPDTAQMKSLN